MISDCPVRQGGLFFRGGICVDTRKRSKTWRAKTWWDKLVDQGWLGHFTHGEMKFINCLYRHGNWDRFDSRPGVNLIQRETKLKHDYQALIAYRLWKFGILTGRSEFVSYRKVSWGYYLNPDPPRAEEERTAEIRRKVAAQMIPFALKQKCAPSRAQLCPLWPVTVPLLVLKQPITSLQRTIEPSLPKKLKEKDMTKEEWKYYHEQIKKGYSKKEVIRLIEISRHAKRESDRSRKTETE